MVHLSLDFPEAALDALQEEPATFGRELRLAAAVKWYETGRLSQSHAAEVAGLSRSDFLDALGRYGVSPFQYDAGEILTELER